MSKLGPLPNVPNCVRVRYIGTLNARPHVNIFWIKYPAQNLDVTALNGIATTLYNNWVSNIKPMVTSALALSTVEVVDFNSRTGAIGVNNTGASGTIASANTASNNVALCISFPVALRFRGGHCRMYLGGQDRSQIQNGTNWLSTYVTSTKAAMTTWWGVVNGINVGGSTWKMVMPQIYTHDANGAPVYRPDPIQTPEVIGVNVHTRVDTQRRRLGKETS